MVSIVTPNIAAFVDQIRKTVVERAAVELAKQSEQMRVEVTRSLQELVSRELANVTIDIQQNVLCNSLDLVVRFKNEQ